jgi:hypothetical protein
MFFAMIAALLYSVWVYTDQSGLWPQSYAHVAMAGDIVFPAP